MTETISLILGAILPPFIDLLTKKVADSKVRFLISLTVCILVGVGINYRIFSTATWTPEEVLESVGLVVTSATTVYQMFWKNASIRSDANKGQD